ncbi:cupin domain-containing protein [Advenella alkanexedens]|jgi:quercetin dioxygenase-like cupin family protein|uniref:Cupin domain-containing protein n=1 Tax=Advenella alkanexedens TaxID=1481665 RepID=A0ABS6NK69_9BURK|nr:MULTISPECIES: cupin domain-containing protein [Advenella]MBV4395764.1 cupin domain-containing protein [Advenella alkanexedens]NLN68924.1 cupin domain-containing protein [Alcaligenaceae bacterium]WKU18634.1 cupin domain-containing protein [Advenella alkanexedens]
MLRCVRVYTDSRGQVQAQEGTLKYDEAERGDFTTAQMSANKVFFRHTPAGLASAWHPDPNRQLVVTLKGHLAFETEAGQHFEIRAGDVLFTEETGGKGHRWRMIGDEPWVRVYITLPQDAVVPFMEN